MKMSKSLHNIEFERMDDLATVDYKDNEIIFHTDLRELPMGDHAVMTDMFLMIACMKGRLSIDKNAVSYNLGSNEMLICQPNDKLDNCMLSPDFEGCLLGMSRVGVLAQIAESDLWNRAFRLTENPLIRINEEYAHLINMYGNLILAKIRMKGTPFHKEIILSIVKAVLYELCANVNIDEVIPYCKGSMHQREVIFRRFIKLLTGSREKHRRVSWYADQLCISAKHLATVCRQVSGKKPSEMINEAVDNEIRFWLKNSDKSVKEISNILNFPSLSFFGKYCREHLGESPTKLRAMLRDNTLEK